MSKELKADELAGWIKKAGESQRISEFQYPWMTTLFVSISYASKFMINQIRDASKEMYSDPRTRKQEERLNEEKLRNEYSRIIIRGWRGLSLESLKRLVPGIELVVAEANSAKGETRTEAMDEKAEIAFSPELARVIMEYSLDFESWVIDIATNSANFTRTAEIKKAQYENLK